ncbi:MAG TPA: hypothetical protein VFK52_03150 [Nocardioidaceae bacterium]|nr:hypothetical protein [Nocardioidaceae bacterium]
MSERELTPDEEAEISRLLADAASPAPMPAEVSARLDDVLAGLVADREAAAPVVPLKSRRWPQVLVAAAAVSLVGFVGANFIEQRSLGGADFPTASSESAGDEGLATDGSAGRDGLGSGAEVPQDLAGPLGSDKESVTGSSRTYAFSTLDELLDRSAAEMFLPQSADSAFLADTCVRPAGQADAYEVSLSSARRAVVMLERVNANAAAVYVYPCGQSVLPVAATLLLGIR